MYIVTGTLTLILHILMTVGIFLLNLLGKAILVVCASIYTVSHRHPNTANQEDESEQPFITMYPELYDFDGNYVAMTQESLETVTSFDINSPERQTLYESIDVDNYMPNMKRLTTKSQNERIISGQPKSQRLPIPQRSTDYAISKKKEGYASEDVTKSQRNSVTRSLKNVEKQKMSSGTSSPTRTNDTWRSKKDTGSSKQKNNDSRRPTS